ncbi:hypothetical protein BC332_15101 [Capsicum chinense]|nr:hypothetical protein BC332_15101 [Capsicum chinense]
MLMYFQHELKGRDPSVHYLNDIKREIPDELGNLKKLQLLTLTKNEFIGSVPASIFNLSSLKVLDHSLNKVSGTLPSDLGRGMPNLEEFHCGENNLSGLISASLSDSSRLRILDLSSNSFTGPIPELLNNLEYLEMLILEVNYFFSDSALSFLASLTNCWKLRVFSIADNPLNGVLPVSVGSLPTCLGNISTLRYLVLAYNRLNSSLPESLGYLRDLIEFNISYNLLSGKIPLEIRNLKATMFIDLSKNNFSGKIPSSLGGLDKLINLSLAYNRLEGHIPDSFGKMLALEFLDLSYNNLGGEIRKSLYVKYLNSSFNKLRGEIPICSPFANATSRSFLSNDTLCGDSKFNVPACVIQSPKRKRAILIVYIILGVGLLFLVLAFTYVFVRLRKTRNNTNEVDLTLVKGNEKFSYYEIEQSTEGFNESNLLGNGSFSMVYKGILKDEYGQDRIVSTRCDVYSFGILTMEIFTQTRSSDEIFTGDLSIQRWVSDSFPTEIHKVVDPNLVQLRDDQIDAKKQCLLSIMDLALRFTLVAPDVKN